MSASSHDHRVVQRTEQRIFFDACEEFDFAFLYALCQVSSGIAEIGECYEAVQDVGDYDYDGWKAGWARVGEVVRDQADADEQAGNLRSARAGYLRAWNYFSQAEIYIPHGSPERLEAHRVSYELFRKAAGLPGPEFRELSIPFEGKVLPGWFWPAETGEQARTLILLTGTDGLSEQGLITAGAHRARERGWNVLAFDGPGQLGAMFADPSLTWRPDYDVVLRAVVAHALTIAEVHPEGLALLGESAGGYFAPKGVVATPEIKALVLNPPVFDYRELILPPVQRLIAQGGRTQEMVEALMTWTFGLSSIAEVDRALHEYRLPPEHIESIRAATLCIVGAGEGPMGEQMGPFFDRLQGVKASRVFTKQEGADAHCILNNMTLMQQVVFDWLETVVPRGLL